MAEYTIITTQDRQGFWKYTIENEKSEYVDSQDDYWLRFTALRGAKRRLSQYVCPAERKRKEHKYHG